MLKSLRVAFALAALAAAAALPGADAQAIDQRKLEPLHRAGQVFAEALSKADAPSATLKDLRQSLEMEAERIEGRVSSHEEKYLYDLYSTAAAEYAACLARYESHGMLDRFRKEIEPVEGYLRTADRIYRGADAAPLPRPEPATPPPATTAPAPAAPPASPATTAPAPAAPPAPTAATAPAPAAPPAPTPPQEPAGKASPEEAPSPSPASPAARLDAPPPLAALTPDEFRRRADHVRVAKVPDMVRGCTSLAEISIPGKSRQGAYEVGGRNFFYEDSFGLARLKTVEAGGDAFLVKSRSKAGLLGEAYRCGN